MNPGTAAGPTPILSVHRARLCPDCDVVTEAFVCPACGQSRTSCLSDWLRPLASGIDPPEGELPPWEI
jgi:hypothetical protein